MKVKPSSHTETVEPAYAEINMSDIHVGGGAAGLLFAFSSVYIFSVGVPVLRWFLVGAIVTGALISVGLRVFHNYKPTGPVTSISS